MNVCEWLLPHLISSPHWDMIPYYTLSRYFRLQSSSVMHYLIMVSLNIILSYLYFQVLATLILLLTSTHPCATEFTTGNPSVWYFFLCNIWYLVALTLKNSIQDESKYGYFFLTSKAWATLTPSTTPAAKKSCCSSWQSSI